MDEQDMIFKKRLKELSDKAYSAGRYIFTGFLSMAELDMYYSMEKELSHIPSDAFGGTQDCERLMLRFGSEEFCGYEEPFPIVCIEIAPLTEKFGEALSHRDYLGALMNLGIVRSALGDIIIRGKHAFLFCTEKMAPYIIENLDKVRHTNVRCVLACEIPESAVTRFERRTIQVSAARADSVTAKTYNLSRSESTGLFQAGKVFVNGRRNENNSMQLKTGDKVTVRGYGRFRYVGILNETKKGKMNVEIEIYC